MSLLPQRFDFLQSWHQYNTYYEFKKHYFMQKEGLSLPEVLSVPEPFLLIWLLPLNLLHVYQSFSFIFFFPFEFITVYGKVSFCPGLSELVWFTMWTDPISYTLRLVVCSCILSGYSSKQRLSLHVVLNHIVSLTKPFLWPWFAVFNSCGLLVVCEMQLCWGTPTQGYGWCWSKNSGLQLCILV